MYIIKFLIKNESVLLRKLLACGVLCCIILSSLGIVRINNNISILESAKVSADTLISHFFYISSLPVDIISKMFIENTQVSSKGAEKQKNNSNDEGSSAKASLGYSILPGSINNLQISKTKIIKSNKYISYVDRFVLFDYGILRSLNLQNLNLIVETNVIMMLLLAILLSRRKMSDDNIIINIINNKKIIARLL
ncbi:MAG: hypothetical protein WC234_06550 [Endomicrobiaceae bacterium]